MTTNTEVNYSRDGKIAWIELVGPHKLNAFSDSTAERFKDALYTFDDDDEAHVAIVFGRGKAFCSGADVKQRQLRSPEEFKRLGGPQGRGTKIENFFFGQSQWKPLICATHGYAIGLGFTLALISEIIVAAEDTRFQVTEAKRGLSSATHRSLLAFRGAASLADDLVLTGRFMGATEAFEAGVVNRVAAVGQHIEVARELAEEIAGNPPLAVRGMVQYRRLMLEEAWAEARARGPRDLHFTADFRESAQAFVEKRPAVFTGA